MKTYLVGGAVRDKLLGLPVHERDWVVVNATPAEMKARGFKQVGASFPVFLHPETGEEYALARTERKTGPGYQGFNFNSSPQVTLEEDLQRRDLTINAMAEDADGRLIDPYGGEKDLQNRVLRHVSPAFVEDPVRVLRVARFCARMAPLGFSIAPETEALMRRIVESGEIDHLVPERVWQELVKALQSTAPRRFFDALARCGALPRLMPEVGGALDTANLALGRACERSEEPVVRFAAWAGALDEAGIASLCERLKTPREYRELAELTRRQLEFFETCTRLPPPDVLRGLYAADALRRPERFERFLLAAEALAGADPGRWHWPQPQREYLHTARVQAGAINARDLTKIRLQGKELAEELDVHRRAAIAKVKRTYRWAKFR